MNSRRQRRLMRQIFNGPRVRFTRRERKAANALLARRFEASKAYYSLWSESGYLHVFGWTP